MKPKLHWTLPTGLPPTLQTLAVPCYVHRTSQLMHTAIMVVLLLFILGGYVFIGWRVHTHGFGRDEMIVAGFLLPFLFVMMLPATWRSPVSMAADMKGIYFIGGTEGVMVPWQETGPFTIERARAGTGISTTVIVTIAKDSPFWDPSKESILFKLFPRHELPPGFFRLPIVAGGIAPEVTKAGLEELRSMAGMRDSHPGFQAWPKTRRWEIIIVCSFLLVLALYFLVAMYVSMHGPHVAQLIPLSMIGVCIAGIRYGWRRL